MTKGVNMERLKRGEFIAMSDEEKEKHLRMLNVRWRKNNPDKVRAQNRHFYNVYKTTRPHICICVKCGNSFNAPKSYYKLCDECKNKDWGAIRRNIILEKRKAHKERINFVIELAKQGLFQKEIAEQTSYSQRAISAIMIKHGMRQVKKHKRVRKCLS